MAATALALTVVEHGFAAACEIPVGGLDSPDVDPDEAVRQSEAMYAVADEPGKYVDHKRAPAATTTTRRTANSGG